MDLNKDWPMSKTSTPLASSLLVLGVYFLFSSISGVSAQYYCLYNFQNTGSNFALVRHAPDPGSSGTWYTATFAQKKQFIHSILHSCHFFFLLFPPSTILLAGFLFLLRTTLPNVFLTWILINFEFDRLLEFRKVMARQIKTSFVHF